MLKFWKVVGVRGKRHLTMYHLLTCNYGNNNNSNSNVMKMKELKGEGEGEVDVVEEDEGDEDNFFATFVDEGDKRD